MAIETHALSSTFAVLSPKLDVATLDLSPDFYERLDRDFDGFRGHWLVSLHRFSEDWRAWERHPAGDEVVVLLQGSMQMVMRLPDGDETVELSESNGFVVVPRNTWHIGRVAEGSATCLFITPGEGTQNEVLD